MYDDKSKRYVSDLDNTSNWCMLVHVKYDDTCKWCMIIKVSGERAMFLCICAHYICIVSINGKV